MFSVGPFLTPLLNRMKAIMRRVVRPTAQPLRAMAVCPRVAAPVTGPMSPAMRGRVDRWMAVRLDAVSALMRRVEAGERIEREARARRKPAVAQAARSGVTVAERVPRGFAWLCAWSPKVRTDGQAFAALLNEPPMKAMVLAAPEQMARLIAPLLNATGERRPEWFPTPAQRGRALVPSSRPDQAPLFEPTASPAESQGDAEPPEECDAKADARSRPCSARPRRGGPLLRPALAAGSSIEALTMDVPWSHPPPPGWGPKGNQFSDAMTGPHSYVRFVTFSKRMSCVRMSRLTCR